MDANQEAVIKLFRQSGVKRMIHGHTHRPAEHRFMLGGHTYERWVSPDWYGERSGYLACDATTCELHTNFLKELDA